MGFDTHDRRSYLGRPPRCALLVRESRMSPLFTRCSRSRKSRMSPLFPLGDFVQHCQCGCMDPPKWWMAFVPDPGHSFTFTLAGGLTTGPAGTVTISPGTPQPLPSGTAAAEFVRIVVLSQSWFYEYAEDNKWPAQTCEQQNRALKYYLESQGPWNYWEFGMVSGEKWSYYPYWQSGWGLAWQEAENAVGVYPKFPQNPQRPFVIDGFHHYTNSPRSDGSGWCPRVYPNLGTFFDEWSHNQTQWEIWTGRR
jgi:hypothetical protein